LRWANNRAVLSLCAVCVCVCVLPAILTILTVPCTALAYKFYFTAQEILPTGDDTSIQCKTFSYSTNGNAAEHSLEEENQTCKGFNIRKPDQWARHS
jgi:hypothetical protein